MAPLIIDIKDLEEYLAILPIGSDAVQAIMAYAKNQEYQIDHLSKRVDLAVNFIGNQILSDMMVEELDV